MYSDINIVIENIKQHFEIKFGENFEIDRNHRFVNYSSASYDFEVQIAFVQARKESDFSVSIQDRIDDVLENINIEKNASYRFTSKSVDEAFPIIYCIDLKS
jgi:hypothetical protein